VSVKRKNAFLGLVMGVGVYLFEVGFATQICDFLKKNTFGMIPYFRRMSIDFRKLF